MGDVRDQGSAEGDVAALRAVHDATGGRNWWLQWDLESDPKTWYGVEINEDGRFVSLKLEDYKLKGKRPFSYSGSRFMQNIFFKRRTRMSDLV